jgi:L-aspartate oxidase
MVPDILVIGTGVAGLRVAMELADAGDGLCDHEAVKSLVEDGPAAIEELIGWGAEFHREGSHLAFAREGAHSRNRILHTHGDSTGKAVSP